MLLNFHQIHCCFQQLNYIVYLKILILYLMLLSVQQHLCLELQFTQRVTNNCSLAIFKHHPLILRLLKLLYLHLFFLAFHFCINYYEYLSEIQLFSMQSSKIHFLFSLRQLCKHNITSQHLFHLFLLSCFFFRLFTTIIRLWHRTTY